MTFAIKTPLQNVKSYIQALGVCDEVTIGLPAIAPDGDAISAQVYMASAALAFLTRDTTVQTHMVRIRFCKNILNEPSDQTEIALADLVATFIAAAIGHFDLTTTIASVDVFTIAVDWDSFEVEGQVCRTAEIELPLTHREAAS